MMKTTRFAATMGLIPGYFHNNPITHLNDPDFIAECTKSICLTWQIQASRVFAETGTYVSAIITPAVVVYAQEWGCPTCGEPIVTITGEFNPTYMNYSQILTWKGHVIRVVEAVAKELRQSTAQLTFKECDFVYLDFRERTPTPEQK